MTILISIKNPAIINQEASPKIKNNIELKFAPNAPKRLFGFSSPTLKGDGSNSSYVTSPKNKIIVKKNKIKTCNDLYAKTLKSYLLRKNFVIIKVTLLFYLNLYYSLSVRALTQSLHTLFLGYYFYHEQGTLQASL